MTISICFKILIAFPCGSDVQKVNNFTSFGFLAVDWFPRLLDYLKLEGERTYIIRKKDCNFYYNIHGFYSLVFIFSQAQAAILYKFDNCMSVLKGN